MIGGQEVRQWLHQPYAKIVPVLNEKAKRIWAGVTAMELGYGGLAPNTVRTGIRDVEDPAIQASPRIPRPAAGYKTIVQNDPTLLPALLA